MKNKNIVVRISRASISELYDKLGKSCIAMCVNLETQFPGQRMVLPRTFEFVIDGTVRHYAKRKSTKLEPIEEK